MLKAVLFDFDGVLIDSYEHTIRGFQKTFARYNKQVPTVADFQGLLGLKTIDIIKKLLPEENEEKLVEMLGAYTKLADETYQEIKLILTADKIIHQLVKGYKLAIVSSRRIASVNKLLQFHKLYNYFQIILGKEDVGAARNAHIPSVIIRKDNKDFGADYKLSDIAQLQDLLLKV